MNQKFNYIWQNNILCSPNQLLVIFYHFILNFQIIDNLLFL